jgi:hypothetical protein
MVSHVSLIEPSGNVTRIAPLYSTGPVEISGIGRTSAEVSTTVPLPRCNDLSVMS